MTRRKRKKRKPYRKGLTNESSPGTTTDMSDRFEATAKIAKVDEGLGLVFGWAIICKEAGEEYFDLQNHTIPEHPMLEASMEFAKSARTAGDMHVETDEGTILFMFPMTSDIAKSFGIQTDTTGLMIGMQPKPGLLAKFQSGEYTGFSIGGVLQSAEEVDE